MKLKPKKGIEGVKSNLSSDELSTDRNRLTKLVSEIERNLIDENFSSVSEQLKVISSLANQTESADLSEAYKKIISKSLEVLISLKEKIQENDLDDNLENIGLLNFRVEGFEIINYLVDEILEDKLKSYSVFLANLKKSLILIEEELNQPTVNFELVYNLSSDMMVALEPFEIPQRKYIYKRIAERLTAHSESNSFISPEDFDFVDPTYHSVEIGKGHRIKKGLSFIMLDKVAGQVIKYGKVKVG